MTTIAENRLLEDFQPNSYEEWREAAEKLLKGAPFDKKMLTKTPEGITLQPIYRPEDCTHLGQTDSMPGLDDFVRGANPDGYLKDGWEIAQELPYGAAKEFNKAAVEDLKNGQNALSVLLDVASQMGVDPDQAAATEIGRCGLSIAHIEDLNTALNGIHADAIPIYFQSGVSGVAVHSMFVAWLQSQAIKLDTIKGGLGMDPLAVFASSGQVPTTFNQLFDEMSQLVKYNSKTMPLFATIGVSGMPYHCAGASAVEELGAVIAAGLNYIRALVERGCDIDAVAGQTRFTLSVGGDFFMEVAKLRAARQLWSRVVRELGGSPSAQRMRLHARTGLYNKTKNDPYVNMLRTTTEGLAAVVGGAESICIGAFDERLREPSEFSRRISRNSNIILQEECELTSVVDPGGGSWYIEALTDQMASKSWDFFREIESEGGLIGSLKQATLQEKIVATRKNRETALGQRRTSLVGTNKYPNIDEKPLACENESSDVSQDRAREIAAKKSNLDKPLALKKDPGSSGLIAALVNASAGGYTIGQVTGALRQGVEGEEFCTQLSVAYLAQQYEELRTASAAYKEAKGHGPLIFLSNLGALRRHKARADFTRAFFEAGGFEIVSPPGFDDDASAVAALKESGATITVICGSDDDYAERASGLMKEIKSDLPNVKVILAGFPGDNREAFEAAGLDDFIFIKSNNYEVNREYLAELGVL